MKKAKSRAVKRISSTVAPRRPKQKVIKPSPEITENMIAPVAVTAPATVVTPVNGCVVLGAACTIHEAQALRTHLMEQAALPGPYEIDGRNVQQVDTAGVQLVVAFALDCLEKGVTYSWKGRSNVLDEAIRVLGVGALLESPG